MTLRDRLFTDPIAFATGCMVWLPLTIWILALVRWMISGEIDLVFGIVGIFMAVGLGYVSIVPPTPQFAYLTFPAVMATVIMFPFVRHSMQRRSLRAVDVEDLERAHDALRQRPDNWAARFRIAKLLFEMGYPGHALRIGENCLAQMPQAFFIEEHRMVQKWRWTKLADHAFHPIRCSECGHPNQPGNVHCAACSEPFLLNRLKGKVMPARLGKKLLAAWITMVALLAGIPLLSTLGGVASVLGIVALMVLAGGVLVLAFWPKGQDGFA